MSMRMVGNESAATAGFWHRHGMAAGAIVAVFLLLHVPGFHRFGTLTNDTGKELGVPLDLLAGRLLYRDTFWPYGPFPPYVTAVLFRLFGAHFDVFLVQAKLLACALCLLLYTALVRRCGRPVAVLGATGVLGFTTTSGFVAVPYSLATLWATVLLLAGWTVLDRAGLAGEATALSWWGLAGGLTGLAGLCKISVAPVLAAVAMASLLSLPRGRRHWAAVVFAAAAGGVFLPPLLFFAGRTEWTSFARQALAGFHKVNIVEGELYRKLADAVLLQNQVSPHDVTTAASTILVVAISFWGMLECVCRWRCGRRSGRTDWPAVAVAILAAGNLAQLNSTVHTPYLFPAAFLAWLLATLPSAGEEGALSRPTFVRKVRLALRLTAVCGVLVYAAGLTVGRVWACRGKTFPVQTPTYSFWHTAADGAGLNAVLGYIRDNTRAGEAVGYLEGYDYLAFLTDRPNPSGFYYTWYEPFHDPAAAERLRQRFAAARPRLIVFTKEESFSYSYVANAMGSALCTELMTGYRRAADARFPQFTLWWRED